MPQTHILREILLEIERNPAVSQKKLSQSIGISVGMVNLHIKRCVQKGFIKLHDAPVRRYLYYLTPEGFAEKASLTAEYLRDSFDIFKVGRTQYEALFNLCEANGWHKVALLGDGELSELALLICTKYKYVKIELILNDGMSIDHSKDVQLMNASKLNEEHQFNGQIDAIIATDFLLNFVPICDLDVLARKFNLDRSRILTPGLLQ